MDHSKQMPVHDGRGSPHGKRISSLRSMLVWLVLGALLPGALGSAAVLYLGYRIEREQLERNTIQTARALVQAVDAEFVTARASAQTLANASLYAAGDLAAFHARAKEVIAATGVGSNFVLSDVSGQQRVNTVRPYPGPLPRHGNPAQLERVFATGEPVISDIYIGGVLRRPVLSVDVPVFIGGKVAYDLSIGIFPERLIDVVRGARLPQAWIVGVFDTQGVIAARTHAAERFVGRKGAPALLDALSRADEGVVRTLTVDGIEVSAVFSRSKVSGWTVAIGIPADEYYGALRQRALLLAAALAVLVGIGVGLATLFAERIARSVRALREPALALGAGLPVAAPEVEVREAAEVASAIGTASDLLAHRTAELENANREVQEFSDAMSHDLRAPLRAIAGYAQIVGDEYRDRLDDEARRLLDRIRQNILHMGQVIDALVDFMHISRCPLRHERIDLRQLAREVFDAQRGTEPDRRLSFDVGELPMAWGDSALLRRVLECLTSNAAKFIPADADGRIMLSGEGIGGETVYHLADNGVGFDMRYAGKLFDVFQRLHRPGEFKGVGIGLAVARRIVGRHGGRIWAEGKVGAGATFHFALPQAPHAANGR